MVPVRTPPVPWVPDNLVLVQINVPHPDGEAAMAGAAATRAIVGTVHAILRATVRRVGAVFFQQKSLGIHLER